MKHVLLLMSGLVLAAGPASAGPVVRVAAGTTAASIQATVDQFRTDLGGPNNGVTPGTQPTGRREINWDAVPGTALTIDPNPMPRFANRGAVFVTPGVGFGISGSAALEFGDVNATYPSLFTTFSAPKLFAPLGSNVLDVVFNVPGTQATVAGVSGFGAVFTDVDVAGSTMLQFFAPDGALLYERAVPALPGNATLSFLGVSFNAGEVVGRVRIVSGNASFGPDESDLLDVVAMDDFIYGEPVASAGLTISPDSGTLFRTVNIDIVVALQAATSSVTGGRILFDGYDVTAFFLGCMQPGTISGGGQTYRCEIPARLLTAGEHVLQAEINFADQSRRRNAVRWSLVANTEP
jgi:hypothetical protein